MTSLTLPARHRLLVALGLLLLASVLGLWVVRGLLLAGFARQFHVDNPAPSQAIVVLLGSPGNRPPRAAELYRRGLAPVVLVPSSPDDNGAQTAHYRRILVDQGVPTEAVRVIPGAVDSTRDEALRTRDYLRNRPDVRRITLVTSPSHTARARWVFRRTLRGQDVEIRAAAAENPEIYESNWHTTATVRGAYLGELLKTIYYRIAY